MQKNLQCNITHLTLWDAMIDLAEKSKFPLSCIEKGNMYAWPCITEYIDGIKLSANSSRCGEYETLSINEFFDVIAAGPKKEEILINGEKVHFNTLSKTIGFREYIIGYDIVKQIYEKLQQPTNLVTSDTSHNTIECHITNKQVGELVERIAEDNGLHYKHSNVHCWPIFYLDSGKFGGNPSSKGEHHKTVDINDFIRAIEEYRPIKIGSYHVHFNKDGIRVRCLGGVVVDKETVKKIWERLSK